MHLVGAHPLEVRDRDHFVELLRQGGALLPPLPILNVHSNGNSHSSASTSVGLKVVKDYDASGEESGGVSVPRVVTGAAAKGRAAAALPPGFAAARAGDIGLVRKLVEGSDCWDPKVAIDKNGSSPLDWAAGEGRLEVCRWEN